MKKLVIIPKKQPQARDFFELVNRSASEYPDKDYLCYRRDREQYSVTFSQFKRLTESVVFALQGINMQNAHCAVIGEKTPEWLVVYMSIVNAGGVAVPLDKDLSSEQIPSFIEFGDCEVVFYSAKYSEIMESDNPKLAGVKHMIRMESLVPTHDLLERDVLVKPARFSTLAHFVAYGNNLSKNSIEGLDYSSCDPDKLSFIIFTSGTTGSSKGVMLSVRNVLFCVNQSVKFVDIGKDDVLLSILPFHHTYEMAAGVLSPLMLGSTVCLNESISTLLSDFKLYRPTLLALVPLVVSNMSRRIDNTLEAQGMSHLIKIAGGASNGLMKLGVDVRHKLFAKVHAAFGGRLRAVVCGGAAMNPDLVERFETFGIAIKQGYGITECAPVIAIIPYNVKNPTSCGMLLPGMQLYIDRENSDDVSGEICVKGENVMLGYYKNQAATDEVLNNRGWFATGDCGYADENNFLYITGRKKNVIVLENGKNVFPEELEEYLETIPNISECMITLRSESNGKQKLTAIIYPDYNKLKDMGINDESVKEYFKTRISALNKKLVNFKQIQNIEIRRTPFPKTSTQKIQRFKVTKEDSD